MFSSSHNMLTIQVKNIGLAAYMRGQGVTFLGVVDRQFRFESGRPISQWRLAYLNSAEYRADAQVLALKALLRDTA